MFVVSRPLAKRLPWVGKSMGVGPRCTVGRVVATGDVDGKADVLEDGVCEDIAVFALEVERAVLARVRL